MGGRFFSIVLRVFGAAWLLGGCTLLAHWEDRPEFDAGNEEPIGKEPLSGIDASFSDQSITPTNDGGTQNGNDAAPRIDTGPPPPPPPSCSGQADGTPYNNKVCCDEQPVVLNTNENCGACGIQCQGGQQCSFLFGHFYCAGCALDGGTACPSGWCCKLDLAEGVCTPELCIFPFPCANDICETYAPGSECAGDTLDINHCSYNGQ